MRKLDYTQFGSKFSAISSHILTSALPEQTFQALFCVFQTKKVLVNLAIRYKFLAVRVLLKVAQAVLVTS